MLISLVLFFGILQIGVASSISKRDTFDAARAYHSSLNALWSTFWNDDRVAFNFNDPACSSDFRHVSVWDMAVAGKAIVDSGDLTRTRQVLSALQRYQNSDGWFASNPGGNDIYIDDNAQVVYVYLDAYALTFNSDYLTTATNLMRLIQTQWSSAGGVVWKKDAPYVASISTTEAALAAARLYEYNFDSTLLEFSKSCLSWMEQHLTDPSDGFYYDGLDRDTRQVNRGKLTYTIGVAISTYAYLFKFTGDQAYVNHATDKASATLTKPVFLSSNGAWNNILPYVHLLFAGFADLITIARIHGYNPALNKQASFIYKYDQYDNSGHYSWYTSVRTLYDNYVKSTGDSSIAFSLDSSCYCSGNASQPRRTVLVDGSAAQIFHSMTRISAFD
ncbi:uncharacterized protein LODBEIA_P38040 [Lodderomyces beijingensis]|uniref:Glycoside hydrolase family 76 protein n=1 Tax=Lodderomyces beijingensis TaxID=1775926 RepID=A0ABP0ZN66_9ASCO